MIMALTLFSQGPSGRSGAPGFRGADVSKYKESLNSQASGYDTFAVINFNETKSKAGERLYVLMDLFK